MVPTRDGVPGQAPALPQTLLCQEAETWWGPGTCTHGLLSPTCDSPCRCHMCCPAWALYIATCRSGPESSRPPPLAITLPGDSQATCIPETQWPKRPFPGAGLCQEPWWAPGTPGRWPTRKARSIPEQQKCVWDLGGSRLGFPAAPDRACRVQGGVVLSFRSCNRSISCYPCSAGGWKLPGTSAMAPPTLAPPTHGSYQS